ncbi:MAG: cysteine desulfurase [Bacteroidetes bacterium]|nr:MAG: cysteine desulfurase [Bacteroidota bacterium]
MTPFDVETIRQDFPALHQMVHGKPLVYFDNAATSQKPSLVIDRIRKYYERDNSNIHRGVHYLSQQATEMYEEARKKIQTLINARQSYEVLFTKGTTEGINLIAYSFGQKWIKPGDEIIVSALEHHSNIVPWQMMCERTGAQLRVIPMNDAAELDMEAYAGLLNERTRLVATVWISNALGTINPVAEMIRMAHERNIPVMLDGAQALPHMQVDVQALDVDFLTFSGHKMFGPTGIGVLYGKEKWLEEMPPFMGGGDMIEKVSFEKTTYNELPHKFEAGTPHIEGGIGLGAAVDYIQSIGYEAIGKWEADLLQYGTEQLLTHFDDIRIVGTAAHKASVISFLVGDIHPYDTGTILDQLGIAVRTGHHCTQPIMTRLGIPGTVRASFAFYNTREEIDRMISGIRQVKKMFKS